MSSETKQKRKPKLHELLAVKKDQRTQAASALADLSNTFEKKQHLFIGKVKTFTPNTEKEGEQANVKTEEATTISTKVKDELKWIKPFLAKSIDAHYLVALGGMAAKADVILEDTETPLISDAPASTLLELEDYLLELKKFLLSIPTLDPAKGFEPAPDKGAGVYQSRIVEKTRTEMRKKTITLAVATEKHPAQVQVYDAQEPIGTIREQEFSAMLTVQDKGKLLERIEILMRAVKKARARANEVEVDTSHKIGDTLLAYVFGL
jgi:hypothetical protein